MSDGRRRTSDGAGRVDREVSRIPVRSTDPESSREPDAPSRGQSPRAPYYPPRGQPLRAPWDPEESAPGRRRSVPGGRDHLRKQTALGRFFATWGWRAYAIPVLVVLTALVVVDAVTRSESPDPGTSAERQERPSAIAPPGPEGLAATGMLPEGGPYAEEGTGGFRVVPGVTGLVGLPTAERFTYTVEIEDGIDTVEFGGDDSVARMVDATLSNPKSWTADGTVAFQRVGDAEPAFRVSLTSPATVRENCGYEIELEASCFNPSTERVYVNLARWVRGAHAFQGDIGSYRQYVVNHEVGHAIGHPDHEPCPSDGALAPIMMQQSFGVRNGDIFRLDPEGVVPDNGDTCRYNAWPFPDGPPEQE